jgi:hypothetical protein
MDVKRCIGMEWGAVKILLAAIVAIVLVLWSRRPVGAGSSAGPDTGAMRIMTWGEITPQWQRTLHVSGVRMGCSSTPESCVKYLSTVNNGTKVFLSILLKPETVDYGQQYSALSLQTPSLTEISLDDFVSQYYRLSQAKIKDPSALLDSFIDGIKSRNPKLQFGATIYENDIGQEFLSDKELPAAIRAKFDVIHFFVHYRGNTPQYAQYIQQLKTLFPRAQMVGGVYAYDRISYLPCLPNSKPCAVEEEMNYFNQSLDIATSLLQQAKISWLEVYPGLFGREAEWSNWKAPRICPGRLPECVANTEKMDQTFVSKIKQLLG